MKKFGKKLMAMTLAGAMALAPMTAFAAVGTTEATSAPASGSSSGTGNIEGWVDTDVFCVVLPTVPAGDKVFDFILDPQDLIGATNGIKYTGSSFAGTAKGLYFKNSNGDYSEKSDPLKVINKSTGDVDVSLKTEITGIDGITLNDTSTYTDTTSSIYLEAVCGSKSGALTADGVTVSDSISAKENAYKFDYISSSGKYEYVIDTSVARTDDDFNYLEFYLTGTCNQEEGVDWSAITATPTVTLTWTVDKHVPTPESDGTTPIVITYKGADPEAGTISVKQPDGTSWTPISTTYRNGGITIDTASKTVTLSASWLNTAKTDRGLGEYVMTIDGTGYPFILK